MVRTTTPNLAKVSWSRRKEGKDRLGVDEEDCQQNAIDRI